MYTIVANRRRETMNLFVMGALSHSSTPWRTAIVVAPEAVWGPPEMQHNHAASATAP